MTGQIKVSYTHRDGYQSTAYIDEATGEGTDKHTDIPVILEWSKADNRWVQIDTWEWRWVPSRDEFVREEES